jgi:serine protease Do
VVEGGPADKAGLEPGDVITSINKQPIKNPSDAQNAIALLAPGSTASFSIIRNGKPRDVTAKVDLFPGEVEASKKRGPTKGETHFGMTLQKLTPELRQQYKLDSKQGLLITDVTAGTEAERQELRPGDLILSVNGKPVSDVPGFKTLIRQSGARVLLRIERSGQYWFVPLRNK